MSDVLSLPTMFHNTFIGAIIDEFGVQRLKITIGFRSISKSQAERIQKYIIDYSQVTNNNFHTL